MKPDRIPTIRSMLAWLVVSCLLPLSLMAAVLIAHHYQRGREQLVRDSLATVRAMAAALDRELAGTQSALVALAGSPHLSAGNLAAFHAQAKEVLRTQAADSIVLLDSTGQQHVNTVKPFGAPLPAYGNPRQLQGIFENGQPIVTDLFIGPVVRKPVIAVGVPVRRHGVVIYILATGIFPQRLSGILARQRLPSHWIGTIFDSGGAIVARSHEMESFVGKNAAPAVMQRIGQLAEGVLETTTDTGNMWVVVFSRSTVSNWTIALTIPEDSLSGELWRSLWWLVLVTVLLLAGSVGLAWMIGDRVAASIRALTAPAMALGFGEAVRVPPLPLREADEVGRALTKASGILLRTRYQAHHDLLTGLANRTLFDEIVSQQLAICQRNASRLAILFFDLNGFKHVNDRYGHTTGDALLQAVAARLQAGMRSSDFVARLGGDEFAAVVVAVDADAAAAAARNLTDSLSKPYMIGAMTLEISASVGIACYPEAGTTSEELMRYADQAMYRVKCGPARRDGSGGR